MKIELTDDEAVLLDGRVTPAAQANIDIAKLRIASRTTYSELNDDERAFIVAVQQEAQKQGRLICQATRMRHCGLCKKVGGYAPHKRSSRHHRKGEPNYKKPRDLSGYELADRFVRMIGYPTLGCCHECLTKLEPYLHKALADIAVQAPERLVGGKSPWKREDVRLCTKCQWEGPEHEMGLLPAIMGGSYHGKCPKCGVENNPFGPMNIKGTDKHVMRKLA